MPGFVPTAAAAVATFIGTQSYSQAFTLARAYAPQFDPELMGDGAYVTVVGRGRRRVILSRAPLWQEFASVDVLVHRRLPQDADPANTTANTVADAMMMLCEELEDSLDDFAAAGMALVPEETEITFEPDHLRAKRVFTGVISLVITNAGE